MQTTVASSDKNIIFTAHTDDIYNESLMANEVKIKVKGALKTRGIEAFFTNIVAAKCLPLKLLEPYVENNPLLNITEEDEDLGFKYVLQTRKTKDTFYENIRSPRSMWNKQETFIDSNIQYVLDRIHTFYS